MSNVFRPEWSMSAEEKPVEAKPEEPEQVEEQTTEQAAEALAETAEEVAEQVTAAAEELTSEPEVDWKKRYDDTRRHVNRQAEQLKALETDKAQLEAALGQAIPYLQQLVGGQPVVQSDEDLAKLGVDPEAYKALEPLLQQRIDARTQALEAQMAAERTARQDAEYRAGVSSAIENFFLTHPDVPKGSDMDDEIGNTVRLLASSWEAAGYEVGWDDPSLYDLAYEAAQHPLLRDILAKNPQYAEDEEGLALARDLASLREAKAGASQPKTPARTPPHVEKGGTTGPAGKAAAPQVEDPWEAVKALAEQEKKSVFTR